MLANGFKKELLILDMMQLNQICSYLGLEALEGRQVRLDQPRLLRYTDNLCIVLGKIH